MSRLEPAPETPKTGAPDEPAAAVQLPEDVGLDDEEGEQSQGRKNVVWWDTLPWQQILCHAGATVSQAPRSLVSAVTAVRTAVCQEIERTVATPREAERGLKSLLFPNLIIFGDLRECSGRQRDTDDRRIIADRLWA